jgi:hypothetical protein
MAWQDGAYRVFIVGSALLFSFLMLDILWDYARLARSPAGSAACCVDAATFTVAIATCVLAVSAALFFIRRMNRV